MKRATRQPEPCRSCAHHAGDHRGYAGQLEARCTVGRCACRGYLDKHGPVTDAPGT